MTPTKHSGAYNPNGIVLSSSSVQFHTNPPDDSGVPHILEHTVLCGSQKYAVRDPFFKMIRRSQANFMNALTGFLHPKQIQF